MDYYASFFFWLVSDIHFQVEVNIVVNSLGRSLGLPQLLNEGPHKSFMNVGLLIEYYFLVFEMGVYLV